MILKELRIKNFRSYYGDNNRFDFSDGLTVIIGDNGDGKTTFFEALQWLLDTTNDNISVENISEMKKSQMEIGDRDEVSVFLRFEHGGEKTVEKSFTFEKLPNGKIRSSKPSYRGSESNGVEREAVNGKNLIDRCYDAFIQRFSMFKGESELNVLDNATTLKTLVDKFSDIKKFDELVSMTEAFESKSNSAYLKEMKSDKRVAAKAQQLESDINKLSEEIKANRRDIADKRISIDTFAKQLRALEDNKETSEKYKALNDRLKTQEDKKFKLMAQIESVNYNHALLDKMWILAPFPSILKLFQEKISQMSKVKRQQAIDFAAMKAKEIGKLEAIKEMHGLLSNGATELPWYLPDQQTMEDMINDQICKVCGREAPVGSDAYNFMVKKLEEYKHHAEAQLKRKSMMEEIKEESLFINDYIEQLHSLSGSLGGTHEAEISRLARDISDRQGLVARWDYELKRIIRNIQDIVDEKSRLLIQSGNLSELALEKEFNDIKGLFEQREVATARLAQLETELKFRENRMDDLKKELNELDPESSQVRVTRDIHIAMEAISKAFALAKKENLSRFLSDMEDRANSYMSRLSASDFHGEIRLIQTADNSTEVHLYSSNGTEIKKPSGSQKTVMYISVLFAISDFTQEKREEDYPLIFDAATSSFGDSKEEGFYNVIDKLHKQCIIVTKDFIEKGNLNQDAIKNLSCNVYRIKKAANFDQANMATIRTLIERIR